SGEAFVGASVSLGVGSSAGAASAAPPLAAGSAVGDGLVPGDGWGEAGCEAAPVCGRSVAPTVGGSAAGVDGSFSFDRSTVGSVSLLPGFQGSCGPWQVAPVDAIQLRTVAADSFGLWSAK